MECTPSETFENHTGDFNHCLYFLRGMIGTWDHGLLVQQDVLKWAVHKLLLGNVDLYCDKTSVSPYSWPLFQTALCGFCWPFNLFNCSDFVAGSWMVLRSSILIWWSSWWPITPKCWLMTKKRVQFKLVGFSLSRTVFCIISSSVSGFDLSFPHCNTVKLVLWNVSEVCLHALVLCPFLVTLEPVVCFVFKLLLFSTRHLSCSSLVVLNSLEVATAFNGLRSSSASSASCKLSKVCPC